MTLSTTATFNGGNANFLVLELVRRGARGHLNWGAGNPHELHAGVCIALAMSVIFVNTQMSSKRTWMYSKSTRR